MDSTADTDVLYSESQRVPITWWAFTAFVLGLVYWTGHMHRPLTGIAVTAILAVLAIWALVRLSSTVVKVVQDSDGERWLIVGEASIPALLISRSLVIPPTAKQAAMGRQLDPAAYVVHKGWIPTMAMFVIDDENDPTPYWLISSKDPQELVRALGRPEF